MHYTVKQRISAVILAAGRSQRMGSPKALLPFKWGNTFLEHLVSVYHLWGCETIVVVINRQLEQQLDLLTLPVTKVVNEHLEYERFYSVKKGLLQLEDTPFSFLQNVDNPFLHVNLLSRLYANRLEQGYVKPVYKGKGGHPVLLGPGPIDQIQHIQEPDAHLRGVLSSFKQKRVEWKDEQVLFNINTPTDYEKLINPTAYAKDL